MKLTNHQLTRPFPSTATMSTPSVTRLSTAVTEVTSAQEMCKDIHCDFEATCELGPDRFPRCSCKFDCASIRPENMLPVCGSDLKIYSSICAMKMEACQRQQELRLRPLDLCQGLNIFYPKLPFILHPLLSSSIFILKLLYCFNLNF